MKAVRFHEFGGQDVLKVEEIDDPEPGPGEVVIEITRSALNHLDVDIREGRLALPDRAAVHLGVEVVGRDRELGEGVDGWQPSATASTPYLMDTCGECRYCRTGRESLCLTPRFISFIDGGGYAEKIACPARQLVRIPGRRLRRGRGRLQVAFATAWHMLFTRGGSRPARRADQLGRQRHRLGRRPARQARRRVRDRQRVEPREARVGEGARHGRRDQLPDPGRRRARSWSPPDGRGVDVVYEHVGGELFQKGSTRSPRTAGSSSAAATRARSSPSTSSRSSARRSSVIGSFVYTRDEVEQVLRARGARGDHAARPHDLPARRRRRRRWRRWSAASTSARSSCSPGGDVVKRLGVDVGGTFTDLIYVDDEAGTILVHKLPTTPDDPSQGTVQGVRELAEQAGESPRSSTRSSTARRSRRTS